MPLYTKIKIVLVLFLSMLISLLTYSYLKSLREETTIVIAVQEIKEKSWIKPEMLKEVGIRKREKEILAPDAFSTIKGLEYAVALTDIKQGSIINRKCNVIAGTKQSLLEKKVITEDEKINTSYFISKNMRIMTVKVDSHGALNNILKTGDWVDVIYTANTKEQGQFSATILQHIKVDSVQEPTDRDASSQNISLILTPQQAVDLTFSKRNGTIDLVLNPLNGENEIVYPVTADKFIKPFFLSIDDD